MAIPLNHVPWYVEIFQIPGLVADPMLIFGYQEVRIPAVVFAPYRKLGWKQRLAKAGLSIRRQALARLGRIHPDLNVPAEFAVADLSQLIKSLGARDVDILDLFDERATIVHNMNQPVPGDWHLRYATVIDIGCLEHLFDTWTCLTNCLRMIRPGGHYVLHTPVNGYFAHGLHVFNPRGLIAALEQNGFQVLYKRYSSTAGKPLKTPVNARDVLMWIVAKKLRDVPRLIPPEQNYWSDFYREEDFGKRQKLQKRYWTEVGWG